MIETYVRPETAKEAVSLLHTYQGKARVIAGGTDLVLDLKSGKYEAGCLVDISGLPELKKIEETDGVLIIGAGVTHNQALASPLIASGAAALARASAMVGSHQIRNVSTLAGNVISAQPAADSAVALIALGAFAKIVTGETSEEILVEELYEGVGKSRVDGTNSLLTYFLVPKAKEGEGSSYVRLQQRKALALPMLCVSVWIRLAEETVEDVRIVMAPVQKRPARAVLAEEWLIGKTVAADHLKEAGTKALADANPRDSLVRGSREYRLAVLPSLVETALEEAVRNARTRGREEGDERS